MFDENDAVPDPVRDVAKSPPSASPHVLRSPRATIVDERARLPHPEATDEEKGEEEDEEEADYEAGHMFPLPRVD